MAKSKHTHVAVNTVQYYDTDKKTVVEVKAGRAFTPPKDTVESLTKAQAIREYVDADDKNVQAFDAAEQETGTQAPAGYSPGTQGFGGGALRGTENDDLKAQENAAIEANAEQRQATGDSEEAAAKAPGSRSTKR
jgi:hypothetical protein